MVLVEGISVVIRRDSIERAFGPEWQTFVDSVPNQTLCADPEIARVGFMDPDDVRAYVRELEIRGLRHIADGKAIDLVVVDQIRGLLSKCDWLEVGDAGSGDRRVKAARLTGSAITRFIAPEGWTYEKSLSAQFGFVPAGREDGALEQVGSEGGLDIFKDRQTGKQVFVGRTHRGDSTKQGPPATATGPGLMRRVLASLTGTKKE